MAEINVAPARTWVVTGKGPSTINDRRENPSLARVKDKNVGAQILRYSSREHAING